MDKISIFLNSPSLGGAERSMVLQSRNLDNGKLVFFIPYTESQTQAQELVSFIGSIFKDPEIKYYHYPKSLYSISRESKSTMLLSIFAIIKLLFTFKSLGFLNSRVIWINGNKVGFPLLIFLKFFKFKNQVIYHLRDYPAKSFPFSLVWKLLGTSLAGDKIIVSNSYDVDKRARSVIGESRARFYVCYNPVELSIQRESRQGVKTIGIASMLVPWKGVHFVINFMNIYKEKLRSIGIEELLIFGENIYHTNSSKSNYVSDLKSLAHRNSNIKFMGNCKPSEIFSKIDILIHPSLLPEPFGRIIIEGFRTGVPVVSTCLGGSGELITDGFNGYKCISHDYAGLFLIIEKLVDSANRERLIKNAYASDLKIIEQQNHFWSELKGNLAL